MSGSFVVVVDHLPEIIEQMHEGVAKVVKQTAEELGALYGVTAAIDTGFMRSSWYVVTHNESSYGQDVVGSGPMLPEVDKPGSDLEAIVAVGAEYAAYLEFGTRNMSAQPAFYPAFDRVAPHFSDKMLALQEHLKVKES